MVTSLLSGRTWFRTPNWITEFSLVQRVHSGSLTIPRIQGVLVVISMGKNVLEVEGMSKTPFMTSLRMIGTVYLLYIYCISVVPVLPNTYRR